MVEPIVAVESIVRIAEREVRRTVINARAG
jgi:hypothetical protein